MFCPQCRSEYRAGFIRCADCDVDLVDTLATEGPQAAEPAPVTRPSPGPLVDYCGFFSLDESREARNALRREGIGCEIVIREAPDSVSQAPPREEYWIRVSSADLRAATNALEQGEAAPREESPASRTVACTSCGRLVASEESFCPHCGAVFRERG